MSKGKRLYICGECQHESTKWLGCCPNCSAWNSFEQVIKQKNTISNLPTSLYRLDDISIEFTERFITGLAEMDRVLGGGVVLGSVVLVGGEPGIGKSTLLLQLCCKYDHKSCVIYVSGEESLSQIKMRAERLRIKGSHIHLTTETELNSLLDLLSRHQPVAVVIDSIQTLYSPLIEAPAGSPSQLKLCSLQLIHWAKKNKVTLFLVGHVTKDGAIAGPKMIEHMVDTVLYFEQAEAELRLVRASKNRFGSVDELGFFLMVREGLHSLVDISQHMYLHRSQELPVGVTFACIHEGSRSLLVEVQALSVASAGGLGRVYSDKVDPKRICRLCAVIEKHTGLSFTDQDIYINVCGGLKLHDTASDLALAMALYSARSSVSLPRQTVFLGEVTLSADIRPIPYLKSRIKTSKECGMEKFYGAMITREEVIVSYQGVCNLQELLRLIFIT